MMSIFLGLSGFLFAAAFVEGIQQARGKSHVTPTGTAVMFAASGLFAVAGMLA